MYHKAGQHRLAASPLDWSGWVAFSQPPAVASWGQNRLDIFGLVATAPVYRRDGTAWRPSP